MKIPVQIIKRDGKPHEIEWVEWPIEYRDWTKIPDKQLQVIRKMAAAQRKVEITDVGPVLDWTNLGPPQ